MNRTVVVHSVPMWLSQTQNWMYTQVRYLPEPIEPHIVCEHKEHLDQFAMPHIHCLSDEASWRKNLDRGFRKLGMRRHLNYLVRTSKKQQARILHSHFGHYGWAEVDAAKRAGAKHVVTFYGLDVNFLPKQDPRWHARYHHLFKGVDRILCEGSHMAQCIVDLGCSPEKVQVQHLGIRLEDITFAPRTWHPEEPLKVLIAASFREKKGIPYALEALGKIKDLVKLSITIIGDADSEARNQKEKQSILSIIKKYNFDDIQLLGYQPHTRLMEEAYKHHVFLSPSVTASDGDTEGGAPVSIIEMAASGMAIISTNHCDIPEVILHEKTGLLAPERDVDKLVDHFKWFIQHSDQWPEMLRAGRKHICEQYDAQIQGERLASIYNQLILA